jgi:hypothetical protein
MALGGIETVQEMLNALREIADNESVAECK